MRLLRCAAASSRALASRRVEGSSSVASRFATSGVIGSVVVLPPPFPPRTGRPPAASATSPAAAAADLPAARVLSSSAAGGGPLRPTLPVLRKGGRMGQHLKSLDEAAHRKERDEAKERRTKKKGRDKRGGERHAASEGGDEAAEESSVATSALDIPPTETPAFDESETIFDHGSVDGAPPSLPDVEDVKERMAKVVSSLVRSFRSIRGAEPTPELFDSISVKAYGTPAPLSSVGQVVVTGPTLVTVTCYDPSTAPSVRDAIRDMPGTNFNPRIEEEGEGIVIVPIPKVSAETRRSLVKRLNVLAEDCRKRIRAIRRGAHEVAKKGQKGSLEGVSKDDAFRLGKEVDKATEEAVSAVNDALRVKTASVVAV